MKKNTLSAQLALGLILISLFLLAGCQPSAAVQAADQPPQAAAVTNLTTLSASDISAYRWQAMADFYGAPAAVHPADRKFSVSRDGQVVALAIQPADRKGFHQGALYPAGH